MMRSRIATAAVAVSLVAGLAACSSTSKAASAGAAAGGPGAPTSTSAATAPTTVAPTATVSSATTSATSSDGAAGPFSDAQLEMMRSKVASAFGQGVTVSSVYASKDVNKKELAADFESPAVMSELWGSGAAGSDRTMDCGMPKYDGIAIGAVKSTGDSATIPVVLYYGAKAGPKAITMNMDPVSGLIKGVACGGGAAADLPGIAPIAAYYGALATLDQTVLNDKSMRYFTPAFGAWRPAGMDYDAESCSQMVPSQWTVALTGTTSSSSAWDYSPVPVTTAVESQGQSAPVGFISSMAVDLATTKISRVTCDQANPPAVDSAHPSQYAQQLLDYYRLAADQKSLGVDAEAAIRPFFVSDTAFSKAWGNTGTVPLLCAAKVPGSVGQANGSTPTTAGSQMTVNMVTWPDWHPDNPGRELSKFAVVLDTSTMKISSITCTK